MDQVNRRKRLDATSGLVDFLREHLPDVDDPTWDDLVRAACGGDE